MMEKKNIITSKNKRNRHEKACSSHLFRLLLLSFDIFLQFLSISFFFLPSFFVSSLSLLHVRAAMAAQSVILITLLTMIIIIIFGTVY